MMEWISDEGDDATKAEIDAKRRELEALVQPVLRPSGL